jgi:hypothetical protein
MAQFPRPVRKPRPQYRTGTLGLPHPSWRQAVAGAPERDGRVLRDAEEFWEALGI